MQAVSRLGAFQDLVHIDGGTSVKVRIVHHIGPKPTLTPTATSIFDLSAATRYAAPVDPTHHEEAAHVTCLSDCGRRRCYSHV
jgi:hypothetical protein